MMLLRIASVVLALMISALGPTLASADSTTQTFDASGITALNLTVSNGNVVVSGWDQPTIAVQVDAAGGLVSFQQQGSTLAGTVANPGSDATLQVPRSLAVTLNDSNGTIAVTGVQGALALASSNGDVSAYADHSSQPVSAQASGGTVSLNGFVGGGQVTATNGPVILAIPADAGAQVDLTSTNGQIVVPSGTNLTGNDPDHLAGSVRGGGSLFTVLAANGSVDVQ
jgi:DUF4097 and DUF4098 domain-containing protein YvlB